MKSIRVELEHLLIEQREEQYFHYPLGAEDELYEAIKMGNVAFLTRPERGKQEGRMGKLSEHGIQNIRYHYVIGIALATRACIRGGMDSEQAYTLSDIYIQHMDKLRDTEQIMALQREAFIDFAGRMKKLKEKTIYSRHIIQARDYIEQHLTEALSVKAVAEILGLHPDYLSRIFHKNMGMTMTDYVKSRRIEVSRHMLKESQASCTQIAAFLGFASCSHYIESFKKFNGVTPLEYRAHVE